jgi:DNA-binding GntR family transcriptional regulator
VSLDASTTKRDLIVAELRAMIASGQIARGDRIRQSEIAVRFDTSTTPVREAMRQLEAEGLLVSSPHRGVRVTSADLIEVKGVYVARRLVEPYAMQRAVSRVSRRDLARAAELLEQMAEARSAHAGARVGDANREFHFLFYDRCGNLGLRNVIDNLWLGFPWDILQVLEHRRDESIEEHERMLACVTEQDVDGVKRATEEHLLHSYLALAKHLGAPTPLDPFDMDVD